MAVNLHNILNLDVIIQPVPKTHRDFKSQPRLHLFLFAGTRQTGIYKYKGGRGNPLTVLFVLDPLYSVQLIENSGGISAMMVIQFSKETHFRQREQ